MLTESVDRGMFTGLCCLCGVWCQRTYCRECVWAAPLLRWPDRKDVRQQQVEQQQQKTIQSQQSILDAYRRRAAHAA